MTHFSKITPTTIHFDDTSYRKPWDEVRLQALRAKIREAELAQKELDQTEVEQEKKHWWQF